MAATVRLALNERLSSDAALKAATGGGVYHQEAPQGAAYPLVIFFKQSGVPRWTLDGPPVEWELWAVKAVALSSGEAETIAELVDDRLVNSALEVDDRDTLLVLRESDINFAEVDGADVYRHLGASYRIATG
jgi:hypothetical protein